MVGRSNLGCPAATQPRSCKAGWRIRNKHLQPFASKTLAVAAISFTTDLCSCCAEITASVVNLPFTQVIVRKSEGGLFTGQVLPE
jgi:hypothetical protein